jgi:hypothetical protein
MAACEISGSLKRILLEFGVFHRNFTTCFLIGESKISATLYSLDAVCSYNDAPPRHVSYPVQIMLEFKPHPD